MNTFFSDVLRSLSNGEALLESKTDDIEDLKEIKAEFIEFIKELNNDEFHELMDTISSIMMDPFMIGHEDDETEEIEGDDEIKDKIDTNDAPVIDALSESALFENLGSFLNERGTVPAAERLAQAKERKKDPRIRRMTKIKNAWRKKCKKRKLIAKKQDSGKWGCGKLDKILSMKAKRWQMNRQIAVNA